MPAVESGHFLLIENCLEGGGLISEVLLLFAGKYIGFKSGFSWMRYYAAG